MTQAHGYPFKEAEKIVFPEQPAPPDFRDWKIEVRARVTAAAGRPGAKEWLQAVSFATFEALGDSGSFQTLDCKIAAAAWGSFKDKGTLKQKVSAREEEMEKRGASLTGRQILRLMYEHFDTDSAAGALLSAQSSAALSASQMCRWLASKRLSCLARCAPRPVGVERSGSVMER